MIGLRPGDIIVFAPTGSNVQVVSDDTIEFQGESYTLNRFVKTYLPDEKRIPAGTYQGPKYFTHKGKTLWKLRLELESKK